MWIPHTDTVVVVTCDPFKEGDAMPSLAKPAYKVDWQDADLTGKYPLEKPTPVP